MRLAAESCSALSYDPFVCSASTRLFSGITYLGGEDPADTEAALLL